MQNKEHLISSNFSKFTSQKATEQRNFHNYLQFLDNPRLFHDGGKPDYRKFRVVPHKYSNYHLNAKVVILQKP